MRIRLRIRLFSSVTFKMPTLKVHLHHSSKIKSHKEVTLQRNLGFSSFYLLVDRKIRIRIYRRRKNIRIRIVMWIRNTVSHIKSCVLNLSHFYLTAMAWPMRRAPEWTAAQCRFSTEPNLSGHSPDKKRHFYSVLRIRDVYPGS
jgi:hypothetical protein